MLKNKYSILTLAITLLAISPAASGQMKNSKLNPQTKSGIKMNNTINDITVKDMDGKDVKLSGYEGKVLLIVNVASKCGYTPQYEGLEKIYKEYQDSGFEILAFPCNDFGGQEPGTNEEIKNFCSSKYDVTFKLFDKVKVLGEKKCSLYERLTNNEVTGKSDIGWNFEKFLIDKKGNIIARFKSPVKPAGKELRSAIERLLAD